MEAPWSLFWPQPLLTSFLMESAGSFLSSHLFPPRSGSMAHHCVPSHTASNTRSFDGAPQFPSLHPPWLLEAFERKAHSSADGAPASVVPSGPSAVPPVSSELSSCFHHREVKTTAPLVLTSSLSLSLAGWVPHTHRPQQACAPGVPSWTLLAERGLRPSSIHRSGPHLRQQCYWGTVPLCLHSQPLKSPSFSQPIIYCFPRAGTAVGAQQTAGSRADSSVGRVGDRPLSCPRASCSSALSRPPRNFTTSMPPSCLAAPQPLPLCSPCLERPSHPSLHCPPASLPDDPDLGPSCVLRPVLSYHGPFAKTNTGFLFRLPEQTVRPCNPKPWLPGLCVGASNTELAPRSSSTRLSRSPSCLILSLC